MYRPILLFYFVSVVWGVGPYLLKVSTKHFEPMSLNGIRATIALAILLLLVILKNEKILLRPLQYFKAFKVSLIGLIIPFYIQTYLFARHESSFIALFLVTCPILVLLLSIPLLGKKPTFHQLLGTLGGGLFLVFLGKDSLNHEIPLSDFLLALSVPLLFSYNSIFVNKYTQDIAPLTLATLQMFFAAIIMLPWGLSQESIDFSEGFWLALTALVFVSVFTTALATYFVFQLLTKSGALFTSLTGYVIVVISTLVGWLFGEHISIVQFISLLGVMLSVLWVQSDGKPLLFIQRFGKKAMSF